MPKAMCQLNLTLDVPVAQEIERISKEVYKRESGVGRLLVEQRLSLQKAGWDVENKELGEVLAKVVSLDRKDRQKLVEFVHTLTHQTDKVAPAPVEGLVKDSYFQSDAFPFR